MKPTILFNTDMVRAILANRKTVTRRVVKPQPGVYGLKYCYASSRKSDIGKWQGVGRKWNPPYRPGDILYVRETWAQMRCFDCLSGDCETNIDRSGLTIPCDDGVYIYKATDLVNTPHKWRPSIHMPKEAARIFLRVTDVHVEQLQDITPAQLRAEGIQLFLLPSECNSMFNQFGAVGDFMRKRKEFSEIWDSTIKKSDHALYGWDANPWVWVIEFERISRKEAQP